MPTTTLAGHTVDVNEEGFLIDPADWSDDLAAVLAAQIGLTLDDAHWDAIRFARKDFEATGESPTIRRLSTAAGIPPKRFFELFPQKPAKKLAYVSGLPKPRGCV